MEDAARLGDGVRTRSLRRGALVLGLGLMALGGACEAAAQEAKELVGPYLRARDDNAVGEVAGHAVGDAPRASAPPVPYEGVSMLLLPYSAALEAELDGIKDRFRDSLGNYMEAIADVRAARMTYERALLAVGGGELIRGEVSDGRGMARLAQVPAGEWLLLAWREQPHPGKAPKLRPRDLTVFRDIPVSAGYSVVSYWRMRLQVRAGETIPVEINDRNVWITGIHEERYLIEGTAKETGVKKRR